jgi:hypothetical protein
VPSEYLEAFSAEEVENVRALMAAQVISMSGRKLEEGDWSSVYCAAKGIPYAGWSNLDIDVIASSGLGVEHKMLGTGAKSPMTECGRRAMHPAMTRQIRIPASDDADEVMTTVLGQYAELVERRAQQVYEQTGEDPDLRLGWLLWKNDLSEFLYFEERMTAPDPDEYYAEWSERRSGRRQPSRNVWVFERETRIKRYSITTSAGAKIQPYFDVPERHHPTLYLIQVEGEEIDDDVIRVWVADATRRRLGELADIGDQASLSTFILETAGMIGVEESEGIAPAAPAVPLVVSRDAYEALTTSLSGSTSDGRLQQLLSAVDSRET